MPRSSRRLPIPLCFVAACLLAPPIAGCTGDAERPEPAAPNVAPSAAGGAGAGGALETGASEITARPNPAVDGILQAVEEYYRSVPSFQLESAVVGQYVDDDLKRIPQSRVHRSNRRMTFARPNRVLFEPIDSSGATICSDGQKLTFFERKAGAYIRDAAPADVSEILVHDVAASLGGAAALFPLNLGADRIGEVFRKQYIDSGDMGAETLDGAAARRLKFSRPLAQQPGADFQWELWIAAEGPPKILQARLLLPPQPYLLQTGEETFARFMVTDSFSQFTTEPDNLDAALTLALPETAAEVFSFNEALSPLVGRPAPGLELKLVDGERGWLADHLGKEIVLLDFWATWCGPCLAELPVVLEIARDYREKGVRLYAVNQREDAEVIREFLRETGYDVPVALDLEGLGGEQFGVDGIPHLVIVGKTGVIEAVHSGYHSGLRRIVRRELDLLLALEAPPDGAAAAASNGPAESPGEPSPGEPYPGASTIETPAEASSGITPTPASSGESSKAESPGVAPVTETTDGASTASPGQ